MADHGKTRQEVIDDAVAAAEGTQQDRDQQQGVKASDNPYKEGKALHRAWERKRKAGELLEQQESP